MANEQKTPLVRTLSSFVQQKALAQIAQLGQALPGHVLSVTGSIVTVAFDVMGLNLPQVTMPVFGPEYIRYPVQAGDKGVAFPASVSIVAASGLGAGTPGNAQQANLSTLVWFPCGNKGWATPPGADANTLSLYGKLATLLLDSLAGNCSLKLSSTGITLTMGSNSVALTSSAITLTVGSKVVTLNSSGLTIDGILFDTHYHTGVTAGSGNTGGPA